MIRVHKIQLYPNNKQATYFVKACGVARFAYNWGLSEWKLKYEAGETVKETNLWRALNAVKREQYPWMREITKCVPELAIKSDLGGVLRDFISKGAQLPKYHKKGANDSFTLSNGHFETKEKKVWIPLLGWVNMAEGLRFSGKAICAVVTKTIDKWYITIQVEIPDAAAMHDRSNEAVGISMGNKSSAALSDGTVIVEAKASIQNKRRLLRLNRELSRRQGAQNGESKSVNYQKTERKISRLQTRMANLQADKTHQQTTKLAHEYGLICIEDTHALNQMNDHSYIRDTADMGYHKFQHQLEYKAEAAGSRIIVANRWFPSSKWCSKCGSVNEKLESFDSEWTCEVCGTLHNRDVNTAMNLRDYAIRANYNQEMQ